MAFIFDEPNKYIIVPAPATEVTVQELVNECRDFEDELANLDILPLISAAWKEDLWWGTTVWITCTLLNGWKVKFEDRAWPAYIPCIISGWNLVSSDWSIPYTWSAFVTIWLSSSSSATNQNAESIQYASFWWAVNVDVNSWNSWIVFPTWNAEFPVNNIQDAVLIAQNRWFNIIKVFSDLTLDTWDNVTDFKMIGQSHVNTNLIINPWSICLRTAFSEFNLTGAMDWDSDIVSCIVWDIQYFNWHIHSSYLYWTFTLWGTDDARIDDCKILNVANPVTITAWISWQDIMISNYSWRIILDNIIWSSNVWIWLDAWEVVINSNCTAWTIALSWNWDLTDNSNDSCYVINKLVNWSEIQSLQKLVEGLRPHHIWTGDIWYWNPYNWNDTFNWTTPNTAVKTFAQAHNLAKDSNHDVIYCIPWNPTAITESNENLTISKNYIFLRWPWRDFCLNNIDDTTPTVTITWKWAEISWLRIESSLTATAPVIHTTWDFSLFKNLWVANSKDWIHIENAEYCIVDSVKSHHNNWYGVLIDWTAEHTDIIDCHIGSNGWDWITINLDSWFHEVNIKWSTIIHKNTWYGVNISATSASTLFDATVEVFANTAWEINDLGTWTYIPSWWLDETELHDALDTYWNKDWYKANLTLLERLATASVKVVGTELIMLDDIGELQRWDLSDVNNLPSNENVFNRIKQ